MLDSQRCAFAAVASVLVSAACASPDEGERDELRDVAALALTGELEGALHVAVYDDFAAGTARYQTYLDVSEVAPELGYIRVAGLAPDVRRRGVRARVSGAVLFDEDDGDGAAPVLEADSASPTASVKGQRQGLTGGGTREVRALVIPVVIGDAEFPYALENLESAFFGEQPGSVRSFFFAGSSGRERVTGWVTDPVHVSYDRCNPDRYFRQAKAALPGEIERAWSEFEDIYFVVAGARATPCIFGGISGIGKRVLVFATDNAGVAWELQGVLRTAIHEAGHSRGLGHAMARNAEGGWADYGDRRSMMGDPWKVLPDASFSPSHAVKLGWPTERENARKGGAFTLFPVDGPVPEERSHRVIEVFRTLGRNYTIAFHYGDAGFTVRQKLGICFMDTRALATNALSYEDRHISVNAEPDDHGALLVNVIRKPAISQRGQG